MWVVEPSHHHGMAELGKPSGARRVEGLDQGHRVTLRLN